MKELQSTSRTMSDGRLRRVALGCSQKAYLVLAILRVASFCAVRSAAGSRAMDVRVMTYNIRYDNPGDGPIFVSSQFRVLSHATLADLRENGHFASDHLPVLAELRIDGK